MALVDPSPEEIEKALRDGFSRSGIVAEVWNEPVPGTTLHRFVAISGQFDAMPYTERQDLAWRIAGSLMPVDDQLRLISSIMTLGREETGYGGNGAAA